ncbi:MAG: deaminase [Patescibacteria group bacterium]
MQYAVVSYIPALHRGYIDFFKKYPGTLYILGPDFVLEEPRMERDIRALTPEEIKALLEGLKIFSGIIVLDKRNKSELIDNTSSIIMPDEDVNRKFAESHLKGKNVTFIKTFLRWDRQISTTEFEIPPDRTISSGAFDREIITRALTEGEKSPDWWRQVGAVLIKDKKPLFTKHNEPLPSEYTLNTFGDPRSNFDAQEEKYKNLSKTIHSEAAIIAEAAKRGIPIDGTSLYITTFPCPACAKSIALAGIKEVYYSKGYSLLDAEDILRAFGVKIVLVKD